MASSNSAIRIRNAWIRGAHWLAHVENGLRDQIQKVAGPPIQHIRTDIRALTAPRTAAQWRRILPMHLQTIREAIMAARDATVVFIRDFAPEWATYRSRNLASRLPKTLLTSLRRHLAAVQRKRVARSFEATSDEDAERTRQQEEDAVLLLLILLLRGKDVPDYLDGEEAYAFGDSFDNLELLLGQRLANAVNQSGAAWGPTDLAEAMPAELEAGLTDLVAAVDAAVGTAPMLAENIAVHAVDRVASAVDEMLTTLAIPVIGWVQYCAILDSRTCLRCAASATPPAVWRTNDPSRPVVPQHPNCRCFWIPVPDGFEAPKAASYDTWLRSQSVATQKKILGPSRWSLFSGGGSISQFVNRRGRVIPVKRLGLPARRP